MIRNVYKIQARIYTMKPHYLFLLVSIFIASGYLSLIKLDNTVFWDDEADTAIVAKNLAKFGHMTGWDGRNLLTYRNGSRLDNNFRPIDSPLAFLTAAASFRLLGVSTWTGRFPFVLAGLCGLFVFALILRRDYNCDSLILLYGSAVLAFSIVFLLNIRQCRYYSVAMMFSLLTFWFYHKCIQTDRLVHFIFLTISAILLFYSNFMLGAAFLLAIALVNLIFHRCQLCKQWKKFLLSGCLFIAATVPYGICYRIWHRTDIIPSAVVWYIRKPTLIWWNLRDLNTLGLMPWTISAGLVYFVVRNWKTNKEIVTVLQWIVLSIGYVLFLSLISPQMTDEPAAADVRYLIPVLPFLFGLAGVFFRFLHTRTKAAALLILILVITTNLASINPFSWKFRWLLPAYINEVHHNYPTTYSQTVQFLKENAKQDETVFAFPDFANYPIMFYAGDKIKLCCTLDSNSLLPWNKIMSLDKLLYYEQNFPDWIIFFSILPETNKILSYFSRPHLQQEQQVQFSYQMVKFLDVFWYDTSRPELQMHSFGPVTKFDRKSKAVYIFKRTNS
jgi:hypothetical protein